MISTTLHWILHTFQMNILWYSAKFITKVITFFFLYFDHENVARSRVSRLDIDLANLLHTSDYFLYCLHTFPCYEGKAAISYFKQKHPNKSSECIQIVAKEEFYNRQKTVILLYPISPLTCLYPLLTFWTLLNHKSN